MPMKTKTLLNRVDTRLAACAAVAAGAAVSAPPAEATIIWSGPVSINIPSTFAGIYLNVVTGLVFPNQTGGWDINPYGATALQTFVPTGGGTVGTTATYFNLTPGTLISAASVYDTGASVIDPGTPLNFNSSNNIIGFRFTEATLNGGAVAYGWIRISLSASAFSQPRMVVEYAYENSQGVGINAGAIPEPSTFALLGVMAAGALGVREWRKRKAA
jgi:hypothetical protein